MQEEKEKNLILENQKTDISISQIPEVTVKDLAILRTIIDTASRRGAFRADEMSTVGTVYDKLHAFLESVNKIQSIKEKEEVNE